MSVVMTIRRSEPLCVNKFMMMMVCVALTFTCSTCVGAAAADGEYLPSNAAVSTTVTSGGSEADADGAKGKEATESTPIESEPQTPDEKEAAESTPTTSNGADKSTAENTNESVAEPKEEAVEPTHHKSDAIGAEGKKATESTPTTCNGADKSTAENTNESVAEPKTPDEKQAAESTLDTSEPQTPDEKQAAESTPTTSPESASSALASSSNEGQKREFSPASAHPSEGSFQSHTAFLAQLENAEQEADAKLPSNLSGEREEDSHSFFLTPSDTEKAEEGSEKSQDEASAFRQCPRNLFPKFTEEAKQEKEDEKKANAISNNSSKTLCIGAVVVVAFGVGAMYYFSPATTSSPKSMESVTPFLDQNDGAETIINKAITISSVCVSLFIAVLILAVFSLKAINNKFRV